MYFSTLQRERERETTSKGLLGHHLSGRTVKILIISPQVHLNRNSVQQSPSKKYNFSPKKSHIQKMLSIIFLFSISVFESSLWNLDTFLLHFLRNTLVVVDHNYSHIEQCFALLFLSFVIFFSTTEIFVFVLSKKLLFFSCGTSGGWWCKTGN